MSVCNADIARQFHRTCHSSPAAERRIQDALGTVNAQGTALRRRLSSFPAGQVSPPGPDELGSRLMTALQKDDLDQADEVRRQMRDQARESGGLLSKLGGDYGALTFEEKCAALAVVHDALLPGPRRQRALESAGLSSTSV